MNKKIIQYAVKESLPITCSYLFVSFAYGIMMQEAGLGAGWSLLTSLTVYTGAFQFMLVTFLSSGATYLTIALTALFMNSRQTFYGLSESIAVAFSSGVDSTFLLRAAIDALGTEHVIAVTAKIFHVSVEKLFEFTDEETE